jgi:hypothetical protein
MTQEQINKLLETELGIQLDTLYSTCDDRVFIRYEEALKHTTGELDGTGQILENADIFTWYREQRADILDHMTQEEWLTHQVEQEKTNQVKDQFEIQKEMLELAIKAGRRLMHDFDHAINEIPEDNRFRHVFLSRAEHWRTIFYPDNGIKNYRNSLHQEIDNLERELMRLKKLLTDSGIDPYGHLPF